MEALREVTEWRVDYAQPNHVYLVDGSKILAYIPWGQGQPKYFQSAITLDRKGRKFSTVRPNPFTVNKDTRIKVKGSNGSTYFVDTVEKTCTCSGFVFRGNCKHVKAISVSV